MATLAHLRSLYATIGTALEDIERVYRGKNLDFPSPDVPIYKNDVGPTDASVQLTSDTAIIQATNYITSACSQLASAVHNPFLRFVDDFSVVRVADVASTPLICSLFFAYVSVLNFAVLSYGVSALLGSHSHSGDPARSRARWLTR